MWIFPSGHSPGQDKLEKVLHVPCGALLFG